jgi:hypothetical protein
VRGSSACGSTEELRVNMKAPDDVQLMSAAPTPFAAQVPRPRTLLAPNVEGCSKPSCKGRGRPHCGRGGRGTVQATGA